MVMKEKQGMAEWEIVSRLATAMGYPMMYTSAAAIMDEIASVTPTFKNISFKRLDELGSIQWPCDDEAPEGTPVMHTEEFTRGKGRFMLTEFVPTVERSNSRFPAHPHHGSHPQPVQCWRSDTTHRQQCLVQRGYS